MWVYSLPPLCVVFSGLATVPDCLQITNGAKLAGGLFYRTGATLEALGFFVRWSSLDLITFLYSGVSCSYNPLPVFSFISHILFNSCIPRGGETGEAVSALVPSHPVRFLFSVALVRLAALVRSENLLRIVYAVSFAPVPFSSLNGYKFVFAAFRSFNCLYCKRKSLPCQGKSKRNYTQINELFNAVNCTVCTTKT